MPDVTCTRCGQTRAAMAFRPFQNELGLKVFQQICGTCWADWLKLQQQLINHYALNVREPQAKDFLYKQMEQYLLAPAPDQPLPQMPDA